MTTFRVVEQHDGRYIVVAIYDQHSLSSHNGETLIPYEMDVRSLSQCYSAISDYVVDSGMYLDDTIKIDHYRPELSPHTRNCSVKDAHVSLPTDRAYNAREMLLALLEFDLPDAEERVGKFASTESWATIYVKSSNPYAGMFRVTVEEINK